MARNPYASIPKVLKVTPGDYAGARSAVQGYLLAHDDLQSVDDDVLRALHAALKDDKVWNQIRDELGM